MEASKNKRDDKHNCHDKKDCCDDHDRDKGKDRRHCHPSHHIHELEKTIKALADSLAHLGRGAHLLELLRIIHCPGWKCASEVEFVNTILDHISVDVRALDRLQANLVEASRKVGQKCK